jgi:hypothetical protein
MTFVAWIASCHHLDHCSLCYKGVKVIHEVVSPTIRVAAKGRAKENVHAVGEPSPDPTTCPLLSQVLLYMLPVPG